MNRVAFLVLLGSSFEGFLSYPCLVHKDRSLVVQTVTLVRFFRTLWKTSPEVGKELFPFPGTFAGFAVKTLTET